MKKRFLTMLLALVMCLALLSTAALAAVPKTGDTTVTDEAGISYYFSKPIQGTEKVKFNYTYDQEYMDWSVEEGKPVFLDGAFTSPLLMERAKDEVTAVLVPVGAMMTWSAEQAIVVCENSWRINIAGASSGVYDAVDFSTEISDPEYTTETYEIGTERYAIRDKLFVPGAVFFVCPLEVNVETQEDNVPNAGGFFIKLVEDAGVKPTPVTPSGSGHTETVTVNGNTVTITNVLQTEDRLIGITGPDWQTWQTAKIYIVSDAGADVSVPNSNGGWHQEHLWMPEVSCLAAPTTRSIPSSNWSLEVPSFRPSGCILLHNVCGVWIMRLSDFNDMTFGYIPTQPQQPTTPDQPGTAYASTQNVLVDGKAVEFQAYALKDTNGNDTNYVKLRDVAYALSGTAAQFSVKWDQAAQSISVTSGEAYEANGSEMKTPYSGNRAYTVSSSPLYINGKAADLGAILLNDDAGNGYTYYKLRDLGQLLNFNVMWNGSSIVVESDKPYTG